MAFPPKKSGPPKPGAPRTRAPGSAAPKSGASKFGGAKSSAPKSGSSKSGGGAKAPPRWYDAPKTGASQTGAAKTSRTRFGEGDALDTRPPRPPKEARGARPDRNRSEKPRLDKAAPESARPPHAKAGRTRAAPGTALHTSRALAAPGEDRGGRRDRQRPTVRRTEASPAESARPEAAQARIGREPQRIAKLLARAGIASRREIERMIAEGRVAKDGVVLETPATIVTSLHGITVDGNPVAAPSETRLFLYHKPSGLLTTERDPQGRPTIYDRLPAGLPRLMPVGRLDLNTEGLLLLTTDGEFKRQLELPSTGITRSYRARAYGNVTQAQLEDLMDGVEIEGVRYGSIDANLERRTGANVWIEVKLTEGKNREVRRVLEYLGLQVSRLIRTSYGPFELADLPSGQIGEVRQNDLVAFRKMLK